MISPSTEIDLIQLNLLFRKVRAQTWWNFSFSFSYIVEKKKDSTATLRLSGFKFNFNYSSILYWIYLYTTDLAGLPLFNFDYL